MCVIIELVFREEYIKKMDNNWLFSSSSQKLLQDCLAVRGPIDENNKWVKVFKPKTLMEVRKQPEELKIQTIEQQSNLETESETDEHYPKLSKNSQLQIEKSIENLAESDINIIEVIENELTEKFEDIISYCMKKSFSFEVIAKNLNNTALEKFCNRILNSTESFDNTFVKKFIENLLPLIFKKNLWFSLEILTKSFHTFPKQFETSFLIYIKDADIPNNILLDFVNILDPSIKKDLIVNLSQINMDSQTFKHNLSIIYALYKDCDQDPWLQTCIYSYLQEFSEACMHDKIFGRLLLLFLQNGIEKFDSEALGNIVDSHRSAFRRPCISKLEKELNKA